MLAAILALGQSVESILQRHVELLQVLRQVLRIKERHGGKLHPILDLTPLRPLRMKILSSIPITPLIRMRPEIVALRLDQIGG